MEEGEAGGAVVDSEAEALVAAAGLVGLVVAVGLVGAGEDRAGDRGHLAG